MAGKPNVQELMTRGLALHDAGRLDEALTLYAQVLQIDAQHADALHHAGLIEWSTKKLPSAIEKLRRSVELAPREAFYLINLGAAHRQAGDLQEAKSCYLRALAIDPNRPDAWTNLGNAYSAEARYVDAIEAYAKALRAQPGFGPAQHGMLHAQQAMAARQAMDSLARAGRTPQLPLEFTSQHGEDLLAWELLAHQQRGFFIEAGAFNGRDFSVTYPFEAIGWTGLLVEPLPEAYAQCVKNRPFSRVVHAALGGRGACGQTQFTVVADAFGGMLSYRSENEKTHRQSKDLATRVVSVPLSNLNQLLNGHEGAIDLVVIDVEGAEAEAIEGFDLTRFRPRLLLIEANDTAAVNSVMLKNAYAAAGEYRQSLVFIRDDETAMLARLRRFRGE